jgi:hypothetical protein
MLAGRQRVKGKEAVVQMMAMKMVLGELKMLFIVYTSGTRMIEVWFQMVNIAVGKEEGTCILMTKQTEPEISCQH